MSHHQQEQHKEGAPEAVEHLKQALEEVSAEPGATIAYGKKPGGEHGAPGVPLQPVGGADEKRHLVVAPAPAAAAAPGSPPRVDVVEAVALSSGAEIRTDIKHGFGASAGPVHVEEEGKKGAVVACAADEKKEEAGGGKAAATTTTEGA